MLKLFTPNKRHEEAVKLVHLERLLAKQTLHLQKKSLNTW